MDLLVVCEFIDFEIASRIVYFVSGRRSDHWWTDYLSRAVYIDKDRVGYCFTDSFRASGFNFDDLNATVVIVVSLPCHSASIGIRYQPSLASIVNQLIS